MKKIVLIYIFCCGFFHVNAQFKYKLESEIEMTRVALFNGYYIGFLDTSNNTVKRFTEGHGEIPSILYSEDKIIEHSTDLGNIFIMRHRRYNTPGQPQATIRDFTIDFNGCFDNNTSLNSFPDYQGASINYLRLTRIKPLATLNQVQTANFCEENNLKIYENCNSSSYSLEAIVDGSTTIPLLSYSAHPGTYTFNPSTLSTNVTPASVIQFKVYYTLDKSESEIITYTINPCVPELDTTVGENPKVISNVSCKDGSDGSIFMVFDRELTDDEFMQITLYEGGETDVDPFITLTKADFNGTTSYLYEGNSLPAGEYRMAWDMGSISGNCTTCLNPNSVDGYFTIEEPTEVLVEVETITQPQCSGDTGSVTLSASGGDTFSTGTLEYSREDLIAWQASPTITNLSPGATYNFLARRIINGVSCVSPTSVSATIDEVAIAPTISFSPASTAIAANGQGNIFTIIGNGTGSNTYSWAKTDDITFSSSAQNLNNVNPGTYTLTLTYNTSCEVSSDPFTIAAIPDLAVEISTTDQLHCEDDTAILTATATNGTYTGFTYEYKWFKGVDTTGEDLTTSTNTISVPQGTYTVQVTDSGANVQTATYNLDYEQALLTVIESQTDVQCKGESTGIIDLAISGGVNPLVFWADLSATDNSTNRTNLNAGTYEYEIRDDNNCSLTGSITISEPDTGLTVTATTTDATTNGGTNGIITLAISDGGGDYGFTWTETTSNSAYTPIQITTTEFTGFSKGTYQVIITDNNNNSCTYTLADLEIDQPGPLKILDSVATIIAVACFDEATGRIDAIYEGSGPFYFEWFDSADVTGTPIKTGEDDFLDNQPAGTYSYTINDSSNAGPLASSAIKITQPTAPLAATFVQTPVTCYNGNDGTITVTATGGTAPLNYAITGGPAVQLTDGEFTNLEEGTYTITVSDFNGCTLPAIDVEIKSPDQVTFVETIIPVSSSGGTDGSISVNVQGGSQPYFYQWTTSTSTIDSGTSTSITELNNLAVGDYTLTVSNTLVPEINGCFLRRTFTVSEQATVTVNITDEQNPCFGENNGSITASVVGTGPYTLQWSEAVLGDLAGETGLTLQNVGAGTYTLNVIDNGSTPAAVGNSPAVVLTETLEVNADVAVTPTCFGESSGSIIFSNPEGSLTSSYSFSIDGSTFFDGQLVFDNLAADTYQLVIRANDNLKCDRVISNVEIQTSPRLYFDVANSPIKRASDTNATDGEITAVPITDSGTPPYEFSIDNGPFQDLDTFTGLTPDIYSITIRDAAGCSVSENIEVTAIGPLTISNIVANDALCRNEANGSITTTVTGEGNIVYSWTLTDRSPVPVSNGANTQNLEGILAGDYILTVTDEITTVTSEVISVGEPTTSLTILDIISTDVSCFDGSDGSIEIQAAGGTGNYTYSINGVDFQPELIFDGLEANSYSVTVRDENLCEFQEPTPVVIIAPSALNIAVTEQIPTSAANAFDGAIYITPEGGSDNYTYLWSGPNGFTSNEQDITNLEAGTYTVIITDANFNINNDVGCQFISEDIIVTEPDQLVATINQTEFIACSGDASAEIVANVQGGVLPYTYQWYEDDNGNVIPLEEESDIINNLANGTYFLIATDDNDISTESNRVDVTQPNLLVITQNNVTDILCAGESTGAISIRVSGGTPPYQYYWSNNETVPDINGLEAGEYTIEVEDSEGCIAAQSIVVASPNEAVEISDATVTDASEYEANDGSIAIDVTGGQEPYTYTWIQSSTNTVISNAATISNLTADTYTVLVSDFYDCEITEEYKISQPDIIEETILQPSCFGNSDGSINLLVNQGNGAFTYLWNTGQTENSIDNLSAGSYTVTVTGFQDGPVTRTYIIENPTPLDINLGVDRVLCANQTLELDASVDDETVTYSWTSDNGFTSTLPNVEITATGNYTVTLQSQSGCTSQGTIYVDVSTDEINAEFAVSSQVFIRESSVAVDISYPLPDGIEWILPIQATIETQNTDEVEFSFAEAGEYEITLITTRGECIAQKTKKILVVARDGLISEDDDKSGQKLIEDFLVYPNPSNGRFSADVTLTEIGEINIKVFSFANNALIASKRDRGKISYNIPFDLTGLPVGVYAVLLETPYGQTLRKVIIN